MHILLDVNHNLVYLSTYNSHQYNLVQNLTAQRVSGEQKEYKAIPVPIHALRIAFLFLSRPNLVRIPITTSGLFLDFSLLVSVTSVECFDVKPSCLAAANSISRADNFLSCSLTSAKATHKIPFLEHNRTQTRRNTNQNKEKS